MLSPPLLSATFFTEEIDHFPRLVTEYVPFSFYFHSRKLSVLASTLRFTDYRYASQCTRELSVQILVCGEGGFLISLGTRSQWRVIDRWLTWVACRVNVQNSISFVANEENSENWIGENHDGNSFVVVLND